MTVSAVGARRLYERHGATGLVHGSAAAILPACTRPATILVTCATSYIVGRGATIFREMMLGYARSRGLKRWLVPVPLLAPFPDGVSDSSQRKPLSKAGYFHRAPIPGTVKRCHRPIISALDGSPSLFPRGRPNPTISGRTGFVASHRASFTPVRHTAQTHRIRGTSDKTRLEMKLLEHPEPRHPGRSWSRWRRPGGILWINVSELQSAIFRARATDADQG